MIDREEIVFVKNILSLHNQDVNLTLLSSIVSDIRTLKLSDSLNDVKFLENVLNNIEKHDQNASLDLLSNVLLSVLSSIKDDTDPEGLINSIKFLETFLNRIEKHDSTSTELLTIVVSSIKSSIRDDADAIDLIKNIKFLETILIATKNNSLNELCNMLTGIRSSVKTDNDIANLIRNIKLLRNLIFTIKNNTAETDLKLLHSIFVAIKNNDNVSLIKSLLEKSNDSIDLSFLEKVLIAIKHNPTLSEDILDSFSTNQFNSKGMLLELIDNLNILDNQSNVTIFGCWYGSILIPKLLTKANKITGIDADDTVIKIAKNSFFKNINNIDFITSDVFSQFRSRYKESTLFINTSCEHMPPMKDWPWWNNLPNDAYFAFQSNDMYQIEGHVNCVGSLEEFKSQLPPNSEVLFEDELEDERGTRYTLVGKIAAA